MLRYAYLTIMKLVTDNVIQQNGIAPRAESVSETDNRQLSQDLDETFFNRNRWESAHGSCEADEMNGESVDLADAENLAGEHLLSLYGILCILRGS